MQVIGKNRDSRLHRVLLTVRPPSVIHTVTPDRGKLVTLIAGSNKRRRLLFVGDGRRYATHQRILFMTASGRRDDVVLSVDVYTP